MIHKHKHLCIFSDAKHVAFRIFVALKVYKKIFNTDDDDDNFWAPLFGCKVAKIWGKSFFL